jgi:hypothetical protein
MEKITDSHSSSDTDTKVVDVQLEESGPETTSVPFDAARTKKLLWKLDWNIVPFLALLYLYVVIFPKILI